MNFPFSSRFAFHNFQSKFQRLAQNMLQIRKEIRIFFFPSGVSFFLYTTSQEPPSQFQPNLGNMLGRWGFRSVQIKGLDPFGAPIRKILITLQKSSSHEPLARMHWYLALCILGSRRLKFVQIKSQGHVWPTIGAWTFTHYYIGKCLKKCSSKELMYQIGQYLA